MTTSDWVVMMIATTAIPAAHIYPLYLIATTSWARRPLGWALMFSSVGLMLLMDLWMLGLSFPDGYCGRDLLRVFVVTFISVGVNLKLAAIVREKHGAHIAALVRRASRLWRAPEGDR